VTELLALAACVLAAAGVEALLPQRATGRAAKAERALRLLAAAGRRVRPLAGARAPRDLHARIAAAGAPRGLGPREVMAAKLAAAASGALAGMALAAAAPGRLGIVTVLAGPPAGFLAPDLWLARRSAQRARRARRELPALLDLLRVTVAAGVSLGAALGSVGERAAGPVAVEWRAAAREVALGVPLADALAAMAYRLPLPEVAAVAAAVERAARHGAPLADTLAAQAREARDARRRAIQEEAARAGPKMQLVVALLLVPSVLLLVAAALAAALLGGGAVELTGP
jgi:tight adherence protein C